jgi:hypothetical protein
MKTVELWKEHQIIQNYDVSEFLSISNEDKNISSFFKMISNTKCCVLLTLLLSFKAQIIEFRKYIFFRDFLLRFEF